ncbi:MAG: hypothetical protein ABW182_12020 [Sphingomonas sp.]
MIEMLVSAALLLPSPLAQDDELPPVTYPALPATAADAEGFVPNGWTLETRQSGDLNGDGLPDLALALKQRDPKNILPNEGGMCRETIDTNPRMLAVALARRTGGYRLVMENHTLIPRYDSACADDWFDPDGQSGGGLTLVRGTVRVRLGRFMNAGGWSSGSSDFVFGWRNNGIRLIGFDYANLQRNTGETQKLSINYLTRRVQIVRGMIDSEKTRTSESTIPARPLPTIDQIGNGMEFDPNGLVGKL